MNWWENGLDYAKMHITDPSQLFDIANILRAFNKECKIYKVEGVISQKNNEKMEEFLEKEGFYSAIISNNNEDFIYVKHDSVAIFYGDGSISLSTTDYILYEKCKEAVISHEPFGATYVLLDVGGGGLVTRKVNLEKIKFREANYTSGVIKAFSKIKEEISKNHFNGRFILISGKPGTGKTFFIKSLISECEKGASYLLVPSSLISSLSSPSLLNTLISMNAKSQDKPVILIIEDADEGIVKREAGNLSALSNLLNITDGIIGEALNVVIIATTNAIISKIDNALIRPGRLNSKIDIGDLSRDKANALYKELCGKDHYDGKNLTLSDIYSKAQDRDPEIVEKKNGENASGQYV